MLKVRGGGELTDIDGEVFAGNAEGTDEGNALVLGAGGASADEDCAADDDAMAGELWWFHAATGAPAWAAGCVVLLLIYWYGMICQPGAGAGSSSRRIEMARLASLTSK